jgi:HAD superfamily hydrolase (TIGR01490 family)
MGAVIFDLDGTLLAGLSSEQRFFLYLLHRRIMGLRQVSAFLRFGPRHFRRFGTAVWKKDKAYLAGLEVKRIQALAQRFAAQRLRPCVRSDVRRRLDDHLARSHTVVLLTGTPDFIARPIAAYLGIGHVCATICRTEDGRFSANPPRIHPIGAAKLRLAETICREFNTSVNDCTAYADSAYDIPLLCAAARPVAVYPGRRLRRVAARRGWEIMG